MELAKVEKVALPTGRRTLVISDIHGNLDFFKALLRQVRFSREDTLILLGDVLEKGVDSLATLRYVMELKKDHMVHMLCGNCDNLAYLSLIHISSRRNNKANPFFHGFGLPNIRTAAEKYGGQCSAKIENGIFTLKLVLPIP